MRKFLISVICALVAANAWATTFTPLPLISPAGSTSGQFIASTGPSSAPAWTTVTLAGLGGAPIASPTFTGTVTIPAGASISGFAPLASPTFTGTVTIPAGASITTPSIVGVTNGSSAAAGTVGQLLTNSVTTNTAITTSAAPQNLCSIPLPAGDWDVYGSIWWAAAPGAASWTIVEGGLNTTSATIPANYLNSFVGQVSGTTVNSGMNVPAQIINVSSGTTAYLVGEAVFGSGTMNFQCQMFARRRH